MLKEDRSICAPKIAHLNRSKNIQYSTQPYESSPVNLSDEKGKKYVRVAESYIVDLNHRDAENNCLKNPLCLCGSKRRCRRN